MTKIIMFYGKECPHCHVMLPLADRLIKEEGVEIEKLEVWHSKENADKMRKFEVLIKKSCGGELGVPTFLDEENNRTFCGESGYEELKKWAKQK